MVFLLWYDVYLCNTIQVSEKIQIRDKIQIWAKIQIWSYLVCGIGVTTISGLLRMLVD